MSLFGDYMKIIFIRHGEPDYVNDSLTENGFKEAESLAKRISKLDVKQFYCSPLGRAQKTAEPTLKLMGRTAITYDWLMEFPGHIVLPENGKKCIPWDLLPEYWTKQKQYYDKDEWFNVPLMQTGNVKEVYDDVCKNLDKLIAEYGYVRDGNLYRVEKESRDTIVIFCHFGIECVMLSHILGLSPLVLWQGFVALPSSVTTIITEEREEKTAYFRCNGFGDVSHLYADGIEPSFSARFCETFSNKDERH